MSQRQPKAGQVSRATSAHPPQRRSEKPVVIFGAGSLGLLAYFYFTFDAKRRIAGFTVDRAYYAENSRTLGLPVVPFDSIEDFYPPAKYELFIALEPDRDTRLRTDRAQAARAKGYRLASYISSRAVIAAGVALGDHVMLLEGSRIATGASIGNNTFIFRQCRVGAKVAVGENCDLRDGVAIRTGTVPRGAVITYGGQSPRFLALTRLPAVLSRLARCFADKDRDRDGFKQYVAMLQRSLPRLPVWLGALYYQTVWNTARAHLIKRQPLAYPGVFADMRQLKQALADRIEAALGSSGTKRRPRGDRRRVLFTLPYVARNDTTIVIVAKTFRLIRQHWPDAVFAVVVSDDFFAAEPDYQSWWRELWDSGEIAAGKQAPPHNQHSSPVRDYIEQVFAAEGIAIELCFTDYTKAYLPRMAGCLRRIERFAPDLALSFSMECVLDTLLYRRYPSIRFTLGEFLPVFSSPGDLFVTQYRVEQLTPILADNRLQAEAGQYRPVHFPVKIIAPRPASRARFDLAADRFYIASISRHFAVGVFTDICAEIKAFLDRHPAARWLLIGIGPQLRRHAALQHAQIEEIPDGRHSMAVARLVDVCVPVTPGNGMTALSAMAGGVPVLATAQRQCPYATSGHALPSDIAVLLGPERVMANANALGQELERLYSNPDHYRQASVSMRSGARQLTYQRKAGAAQQFACIVEGLQRGRQRLGIAECQRKDS